MFKPLLLLDETSTVELYTYSQAVLQNILFLRVLSQEYVLQSCGSCRMRNIGGVLMQLSKHKRTSTHVNVASKLASSIEVLPRTLYAVAGSMPGACLRKPVADELQLGKL